MRQLSALAVMLFPAVASSQASYPNPREAALRWVIARQLVSVQPQHTVLVREPSFRQYHATEKPAPPDRETAGLVNAIGQGARAVSGDEALVCIRYDCAARGESTVIVVRDAEASKADSSTSGVLVTVYSPGAGGDRSRRTLYAVVIDVQKTADGWRAVRTRMAGPSVPVRIKGDSLQSSPR